MKHGIDLQLGGKEDFNSPSLKAFNSSSPLFVEDAFDFIFFSVKIFLFNEKNSNDYEENNNKLPMVFKLTGCNVGIELTSKISFIFLELSTVEKISSNTSMLDFLESL